MDGLHEDKAEGGKEIENAGWRQCSVFRPDPERSNPLPDYLVLKPTEWLVVCTQSCSVCAASFTTEPLLEVITAEPLAKYNKGHGDAKGNNNRILHIPVEGLPGAEGLACHMGRRAFIPRAYLRGLRPSPTWVNQSTEDAFKGWLANYYMRIALPETLVRRIKEDGGMRSIVLAALNGHVRDKLALEGVESIWTTWSPNEDIGPDKFYEMTLVVVCDDEETREHLDRQLSMLIGIPTSPLSVNGIFVTRLEVETKDTLSYAAICGLSRFNEWDNLSSLYERLDSMRSTPTSTW